MTLTWNYKKSKNPYYRVCEAASMLDIDQEAIGQNLIAFLINGGTSIFRLYYQFKSDYPFVAFPADENGKPLPTTEFQRFNWGTLATGIFLEIDHGHLGALVANPDEEQQLQWFIAPPEGFADGVTSPNVLISIRAGHPFPKVYFRECWLQSEVVDQLYFGDGRNKK